ncbi:MAG: hypothetical protein EOP42_34075, partial [Sphingobacteriaceae bacterium]
TSYVFFFDADLLAKSKKINLQITNASIEKVLEACFREQGLEYAIVGNIIVVKKKQAAPVPVIAPIVETPPAVRFYFGTAFYQKAGRSGGSCAGLFCQSV